MINVKVSIAGFKTDLNIAQYIGNFDNTLNGCKFFINSNKIKDPDYWFVIENLDTISESSFVNEKNLYFLTSETLWNEDHWIRPSKKGFLEQFNSIYSNYDTNYKEVKSPPFLPWMINANHGDSIFDNHERDVNFFIGLNTLNKTKNISMITSNKIFSDEHKLRYDFAEKISKYFGNDIDWYGNGVNEINEKWDGVSPYKYHIVLENKRINYVMSEKLYDSFLGLSFPFYSGAPNVKNYFPEDSLQAINILDIKGSIKKIEEGVKNNLYEKNFTSLIKSKNIVLNELNLFMRIANIVNNDNEKKSLKKKRITLKNVSIYEKKYRRNNNVKKNLYKIINSK